jgi:hypothetical protein
MTIASRDPLHSVGKLSDIEFQLRFGMSKEQARHLNDEKARQKRYNLHAVKRRIDEAAVVSRKVGDHVRVTKGPHKGIPHKIIHVHDDGGYNVVPLVQGGQPIHYRLGAARCTEKELEQPPKQAATPVAKAPKAAPKPKEPEDKSGHVSVKNKEGKFAGRFKSMADAEKAAPADKGHTYHMHKVNEEEQIDEAAKGIQHRVHYSYDTGDKSRASGTHVIHAPDTDRARSYASADLKHRPGLKIDRVVPLKEGEINELSKNLLGRYIGKSFPAHDVAARKTSSFGDMVRADNAHGDKERAAIHKKEFIKHDTKRDNRRRGIETASKKIAEGEEVNEVSKDLASRYFNKAAGSRSAAEKDGNAKVLAKRDAGTTRAFNKITEGEVITEGALANIAINAAQDVRHRNHEEAKEHISNTIMAVVNQHKDHERTRLHGSASDAIKAGCAHHMKLNEARMDPTHHIHIQNAAGKSQGKIAVSAPDMDNAKWQASNMVGKKPYRGMTVSGVTKINEEEMNEDIKRHPTNPKAYVKILKGGIPGFKASDKSGHVKWFNGLGKASAHKHAGMDVGADSSLAIKEDEINELSTKLLGKYASMAITNAHNKHGVQGVDYSRDFTDRQKSNDKMDNRLDKAGMAFDKIDKADGLRAGKKVKVAATNEDIELTEARRGRPPKNAVAGREEDEREHVMMQLRKSVSLNGSKPMKFKDGSSHHVSSKHAEHALAHYAGMSPAHKEMFQGHIDASHANLMNYDKWKPTETRTVKKPVHMRPLYLTPMQKRLNLIKAVVAKQAKR